MEDEKEFLDNNDGSIQEIHSTFFRRLVALIIDLLALGLLGYILGLFFMSSFALAAHHGVLIGWFIATIYFAFGNSHLLSGQTLGKKVLSIKVVDLNGQLLTIKIATIRSLLFTTPFFLLGYIQELSIFPDLLNIFIGGLSLAYYVGLFYFFVFNTKSRQTLHDIISKTLVVRVTQHTQAIPIHIGKLKFFGYLGVLFSIIALFTAFYVKINDTVHLTEIVEANQEVLVQIATEINEMDEILYVESSKIHITIDAEVGIVIEAWTRKHISEIDIDKLHNQIFNTLSDKTFNINKVNYSEIVLKYGYDIGIADYKISKSWKKNLKTRNKKVSANKIDANFDTT